jgi:hypothetical protein
MEEQKLKSGKNQIISTYMDNNYYTITTTFGDIKFKYILTK